MEIRLNLNEIAEAIRWKLEKPEAVVSFTAVATNGVVQNLTAIVDEAVDHAAKAVDISNRIRLAAANGNWNEIDAITDEIIRREASIPAGEVTVNGPDGGATVGVEGDPAGGQVAG